MPHPGLKVTNRRDFDGRLEGKTKSMCRPNEKEQTEFSSFFKDIERDFKTQLGSFVPELFRPDNPNFVKEINGEEVTAIQLFEYFKVSSKIKYF